MRAKSIHARTCLVRPRQDEHGGAGFVLLQIKRIPFETCTAAERREDRSDNSKLFHINKCRNGSMHGEGTEVTRERLLTPRTLHRIANRLWAKLPRHFDECERVSAETM